MRVTAVSGLAATWRALGARGFAAYALMRGSRRLPGIEFYAYRLVAVPRAGMPDMPRGFSVAELDAGDLAALGPEFELRPAAVRHRMGQGMTCLGARRGGRLRGVTFLTAGPFDEDEAVVRFRPPANAAWDTGLFVRPDDRAGRAFAALWAGTADWLAARGLDWSISRINIYSQNSLAAHFRMDALDLGPMAAFGIGGRQWLWNAARETALPDPATL